MSTSTRNIILHYALGGGLGHLQRQLSLANEIQSKSTTRSVVVTNSSLAKFAPSNSPRVEVVKLSPECSPVQSQQSFSTLIEQLEPTAMIVDVFPRGIGGELVDILPQSSTKKILISRNLPADYVSAFNLEPFVDQNFDLVIRVETQAPFLNFPNVVDAIPIVNIPAKPQNNPRQKSVLVVGSGSAEESQQWEQLAEQLRHAPDLAEFAIDYVGPGTEPAFDKHVHHRLSHTGIAIGNAGYNLFWECRITNCPAILFSRERKYDDQSLRSHYHWPPDVNWLKKEIPRILNNSLTALTCKTANQASMAAQTILDYLSGDS